MCGCDTSGHGLVVDLSVLDWWLDLTTLRGFSILNDSMIQ